MSIAEGVGVYLGVGILCAIGYAVHAQMLPRRRPGYVPPTATQLARRLAALVFFWPIEMVVIAMVE